MRILILITTAAVVGQAGFGADIDVKAAFAKLKSLAGEWSGETKMGKAQVTYELIAGGSVVVERESMPHMDPMVTMYHLDGDRLILTHYCTAGNQPRMQARAYDPKTGEIRFEFLDATNLKDQNTGHMHNATLRLGSTQRIDADWEFYVNGKKSETESFTYVRVR